MESRAEATHDRHVRAEEQVRLSASASGAAGYSATTADDGSAAGAAAGPVRRRSGGGGAEDRRQFQAARQEVVRTAVLNTRGMSGFLVMFGVILVLIPALLMAWIEVWSWVTLILYGNKPCDQDLAFWLLVRNMMSILAPRMPTPGELDEQLAERQRVAARWAAVLSCGWLVVGFVWTNHCKLCQETNPDLYGWVRFLTFFGLVLNFLRIFFPLVILLGAMAYHGMVSRGWIKSPNAANDNAIECMQEVTFDPATFGAEANSLSPDSCGIPADCCCCMEDFNALKKIVRTPCGHYFHKDCLREWLALSKTCPLCRSNLDIDEPPAAASAV